jgi:hypothetical protein
MIIYIFLSPTGSSVDCEDIVPHLPMLDALLERVLPNQIVKGNFMSYTAYSKPAQHGLKHTLKGMTERFSGVFADAMVITDKVGDV